MSFDEYTSGISTVVGDDEIMDSSIIVKKRGKKASIILNHDLTIYQAMNIKEALLKAFNSSDELDVEEEETKKNYEPFSQFSP